MFTVVYRTGGYESCLWRQCLPVATMQEAASQKGSIERGGRKALIQRTSAIVSIGLPIGWCSTCDPHSGECTARKGCEGLTA